MATIVIHGTNDILLVCSEGFVQQDSRLKVIFIIECDFIDFNMICNYVMAKLTTGEL